MCNIQIRKGQIYAYGIWQYKTHGSKVLFEKKPKWKILGIYIYEIYTRVENH